MHIIGTSARPDLPLAVIAGAGALGMAMARRMAQNYRVLLADIDAERTEANAGHSRRGLAGRKEAPFRNQRSVAKRPFDSEARLVSLIVGTAHDLY